MYKKTLIPMTIVLCLTIAQGVLAETRDQGWYAKALADIGALADSDLDSTTLGTGDSAFDLGFGGGAALGYDFGQWRFESELVYRTNGLDQVSGTSFDGASDGDLSSLGFAANALLDFNLFGSPKVESYVGLGLVWFEEIDIDFEQSGVESSFSSDGNAWQAIAGVDYTLRDNWSMFGEVRYLFSDDLDLSGEDGVTDEFTTDYDRTSVTLGIKYRF